MFGVNQRDINNQQNQWALNKYGKTENSISEDVEILLKWLKDQKHFPEIMDVPRIRMMYLLSRCSIEATKQRIDNYYTLRATYPQFFLPLDHPDLKQNIELAYYVFLPKLSPNGSRVTIIRIRKFEEIDMLDPEIFVARGILSEEIRLKRDSILSDIIIIDMKGFTWGQVLKVTPAWLSKVYTVYQKVFTNKFEGILIVNSWSSINYALKIFKGVVSEKIFNRIHILEDYQSLHEILPKEMIPNEYGGSEKSMEELHQMMNELLEQDKDWLSQVSKFKVDEKMRPEKLTNDADTGYYGNFKQLSVD